MDLKDQSTLLSDVFLFLLDDTCIRSTRYAAVHAFLCCCCTIKATVIRNKKIPLVPC